MANKKKVLMLSDHALCTSGVGVQSRHLIEGLIKKGCWSFRQFGAAIKHGDYETVVVNDDFIIKPVDGFGTPEMLRVTLATEKPDAVFLFTDPRFFTWLFEMEDEIHQVCPIVWWHVWDNRPTPRFNDVLYESTDLINCHSHLTYEVVSENFPEKTNFIPHSLPEGIFFPMSKKDIDTCRVSLLGKEREDHFVVLWINRNARRKRPADLVWAWSMFVKEVKEKYGHDKVTLLMHTDPGDHEGPNLFSVVELFDVKQSVVFSTERVDFNHMNVLHNISDACIQVSYAEGFGLSTLEAMQTGTPIIATTTGGLTRQVVDHRDGTENGVALPIELKSLVGSQSVPYIFEDYTSAETIAAALMKMFEEGPEGRKKLGEKARKYVLSEFLHQDTIDKWHDTLMHTIDNWKDNHNSWVCRTF
tara:strand:- start:24847 stop:26094 length:1248 start_codon:yes stop_codon:yes gene_type:complete